MWARRVGQAIIGCLVVVALSACSRPTTTYRDVVQDFSNHPVGEITPQRTVGQSFVPNHNHLSGIAVLMATYARTNRCSVNFHLRLDGSDQDIYKQELDCSAVRDNSWVRVNFPPVNDSPGKKFVFFFESQNGRPGNAVTVWMAAIPGIYTDGNLLINGKVVPGALRFTTFHQE